RRTRPRRTPSPPPCSSNGSLPVGRPPCRSPSWTRAASGPPSLAAASGPASETVGGERRSTTEPDRRSPPVQSSVVSTLERGGHFAALGLAGGLVGREVARLRVVDHQRDGAVLRVKLVAIGQAQPDLVGSEQPQDRPLLREVR